MVGGGPADLVHHLICLSLLELRIYRGRKRGKISICMARNGQKSMINCGKRGMITQSKEL